MSTTDFETPEACEAAFYAAFAACDVDAMMAVWALGAPLLCIHPGQAPLTGRDAIARSWAGIFDGGAKVRFTLTDHRVVDGTDVSVRFVHENIHHGPGLRSVAVVCATNVYVREAGGWRMCSHHASPGPAPPPSAGDAVN